MDSSVRSLLLVVLVSLSLILVTSPGPARALQPHAPIFIARVGLAENFTDAGATGTGTFDDPYVISDLEITANASAGIHIKSTQSYFIISNVYIHPQNFTGASSGIFLEGVSHGTVENVRVSNFYNGISFSGSQNILTMSEAWNNTNGVVMSGSGNTASYNQIHDNAKQGVTVTGSIANRFTHNSVSANGQLVGDNVCHEPGSTTGTICDGEGFGIVASSNNIFENNNATGNFYYGFRTALDSHNNIYRYNNISLNQFGLIFTESTGNQAYGNLLTNNLYGIGLEGQDTNNNVTQNRITNNDFGVYVFLSTENTIYDNYLQNAVNAYDSNSTQNAWNVQKSLARNILGGPFRGGNFYSDYPGGDPDGDGMGNTPYVIHGVNCQPQPCQPGAEGRDLLPLVQAQPTGPVVDVEVRSVVALPASGRTGATVNLTITVFNEGTVQESFTVTATYNGTVIGNSQHQINGLPALNSQSFTVAWDTNGLGPGTYVVRANATTVPGEQYTGNNISPPTMVTLSLNQAPTASFSITPTSTFVGSPITLDGTTSSDPDGIVSGYSWNFGDGATATGPAASHSYSTAGVYTITLTVRDNEGATSTPVTDTLIVSSNKPFAPTNLMITAINGKPSLKWSAPTNTGGSPITVYRIYRGTSPDSLSWVANVTGTETGYVDSTATSGQTYYYRVSAANGAAEGDQSSVENVLVPSSEVARLPMTPLMWLGIAAIVVIAVALGVFVIRRRSMRTAK